ncbi:putative MULE transposase domain-containing protein [Rosa chinensis]|uniref:Putative MULE transposase domain-containing protein n=1 Tax=Rosa chinensis TaxID=74649 RepID=A0A2P6RKV9_ROSCH|nr:putative MULE transposase domain-containing protein [Rosa chinensis]
MGQLLSVVDIDGNNEMYPIDWAIVEQETRYSWTWFLTFLKDDLEIEHSAHYVFISDKQKGLGQAIVELFPHSKHQTLCKAFTQ